MILDSILSERLKKLNDLLRDEVGKILLRELDQTEETLITVTRANVSPTLEHATIWISVLPETKAKFILTKIGKTIFQIQQILNKTLVMRPVPKISFALDKTEEKANRIEEIIKKVVR